MKIKVCWHKGVNKPFVNLPAGFDGNTKQRPKYFDTKSAAADFAKVVDNWRAARKLPKIDGSITVSETETALVAILREHDVRSVQQLSEVLEHWKRFGSSAIVQISLREAVEEFLEHVRTNERPRPAYLTDIMGKLN